MQDNEEEIVPDSLEHISVKTDDEKPQRHSLSLSHTTSAVTTTTVQSQYPASVSIGELLRAGKLVAPANKQKASLTLEYFDINNQEWSEEKTLNFSVCLEKFSSGGFRNAFKCIEIGCNAQKKCWVLKLYNEQAKNTIENQLMIGLEEHARKQVQMNEVARYISKKLQKEAPQSFGNTFFYNKVYYTKYNDEDATIEEYIPGNFVKYINNDGHCIQPPERCTEEESIIYEKAKSLVHFSYVVTEQKMMLMDIQGADYALCDPEISTESLTDVNVAGTDPDEWLFCCGNLSTKAIHGFLEEHTCNEYCKMLGMSGQAKSHQSM